MNLLKSTSRIMIFKNFFLNIIASIILTFSTQIIAYPFVSRILSVEEYGYVLLLMGIANFLGVSFGSSLNNTRLLLEERYNNENVKGDYNLFFIYILLINTFLIFFLIYLVNNKFEWSYIWIWLISNFILLRSYYSVDYRINLDFKNNLYSTILGLVGYLLGGFISFKTGQWMFVFILGELFICLYVIFTVKIIREPLKFTHLKIVSMKKYLYLFLGTTLATIMVYMDRILLFPLLGPDFVSYFTVASFLGKTTAVLLAPIASVLLSYYVKEKSISKKIFYTRLLYFFIVSIIVYGFILLFGNKIIEILYPTIYPYIGAYFNIANLGAIFFVLGNLIQPILLRFGNEKWQPIIEIVYLIIYFMLSIYAINTWGLLGFCYAILISNLIRVGLFIVITLQYVDEK